MLFNGNADISVVYLNTLLSGYTKMLEGFGLTNARLEGCAFKANYAIHKFGLDHVAIEIVPAASEDAQHIWLYIRVPIAHGSGLEPLVNKYAAGQIVEYAKDKIPGIAHKGGTVTIPVNKYVNGITIYLSEYTLKVTIRK